MAHAVTAKVETSNKVVVFYTCKKTYSQKQKLKCTQYCHSSAWDCRNVDIPKEGTETVIVDRLVSSSNSDSPPFLLSNSKDNPLLPDEFEHSLLLPLDEKRLEQYLLAPISDIPFLNQRHGHKPSIKKPCANTRSNQNRNKINAEAQVEAHAEIIEALNLVKN